MVRLIAYGIFGWCSEIVWTASYILVASIMAGRAIDWRLRGHTYIWMLPIYGAGGLLFEVAHAAIAGWAWPIRGLVYMLGCFTIEWYAGRLLQATTGRIPWDYSDARWNVRGLIRLDYAPVWFAFGMLLEHVEVIIRAIDRAL